MRLDREPLADRGGAPARWQAGDTPASPSLPLRHARGRGSGPEAAWAAAVHQCIPSWQQDFELEREFQAVAAARLVEKMLDRRPAQVVLAGDLDAEPDSASVRFLAGLQSLGGTSVRYRDAWRAPNRRAWPHVHPANPLVTTGESGVYALELGRRIDYVFVRCSDHGPTLDIRACDRLFDQPIDRVWASDHFGVTAQPLGYACRRPASALIGNRLHARASAET